MLKVDIAAVLDGIILGKKLIMSDGRVISPAVLHASNGYVELLACSNSLDHNNSEWTTLRLYELRGSRLVEDHVQIDLNELGAQLRSISRPILIFTPWN